MYKCSKTLSSIQLIYCKLEDSTKLQSYIITPTIFLNVQYYWTRTDPCLGGPAQPNYNYQSTAPKHQIKNALFFTSALIS